MHEYFVLQLWENRFISHDIRDDDSMPWRPSDHDEYGRGCLSKWHEKKLENSDVHSIVAFSPDNRKCIFIGRLIHVGTGIRFHFTRNKITRLTETIHSIIFLTCCRHFQRSESVLITLRYKTFNVTRFTLAASLQLKNFEVCRKESPIFFSTFASVICKSQAGGKNGRPMPKEFFLFFSSKEYNLGAVACHGSKTINVTVNFGTENHQVFFSQDPYKFRKHVQPINVIAVRFFSSLQSRERLQSGKRHNEAKLCYRPKKIL